MYHKICIVSLTLLLIHSKILLLIFRFATVAHLAEQHIRNVQVAGSIPASGSNNGGLAQLGARMTGSHEVTGSSPVFSTR